MPINEKKKIEESTTTTIVSPYKPGAISSWLQTSTTLGSISPLILPSKGNIAAIDSSLNDEEDDEDDDDDEDDASEDERLLQLRRLEDGTDWMALYEKIMRDGDETEMNDDEDDKGEKNTSLKKKYDKKPMVTEKKTNSITSALSVGTKQASVPSFIRAGGVAVSSSEAANVAILPRNSSTISQKKQSAVVEPQIKQHPTKVIEKKAVVDEQIQPKINGGNNVKRPRASDEVVSSTTTEKKVKRELPKPFIPVNSSECVFVSNIPEGTPPEALSKLLSSSFGKVRTVHYEKSNQGKDCSFGYVEFESQSSVKSAIESSSGPTIAGRVLKIGEFTPESNYRNADGSRKRNKKETKKKEKLLDEKGKAIR
jgi:hypothetical protein